MIIEDGEPPYPSIHISKLTWGLISREEIHGWFGILYFVWAVGGSTSPAVVKKSLYGGVHITTSTFSYFGEFEDDVSRCRLTRSVIALCLCNVGSVANLQNELWTGLCDSLVLMGAHRRTHSLLPFVGVIKTTATC